MSAIVSSSTHAADATDQPPRLADLDLIGSDQALIDALRAEGAAELEDEARALGTVLGSADLLDAGFAANERPPQHVIYDRSGVRTDDIVFDPAWHRVLGTA